MKAHSCKKIPIMRHRFIQTMSFYWKLLVCRLWCPLCSVGSSRQENYASSHKGIRENGKVRDMAVMPKINTDHKRGDRNRFQLGFKTTPKMLVPICATTSLISMTTNFVEEYGQQYARQWSWIAISWRSTYEWRSCIVLRGGCTQWSLKRSKATQVGRANRLQICNLNWLLYGCVLPESRHHCSFLALIR